LKQPNTLTDNLSDKRENEMAKEGKGGLNLSALAGPIGQIDLKIGTVFLYQANETVRESFRSMTNDKPEQRGRATLAQIISLEKRTGWRDKIVPIPDETFSALTEDDIASIAELFRQRLDRNRVVPERPFPSIEPRVDGESAIVFFDRVLGTDIATGDKDAKAQMKRLIDVATSPASKLLEQLNLSSDRLGNTVREFEKFNAPILNVPEYRDHMGEMTRRIAKEKNEDREVARLTGEMTKQSAEMLQELVKTAGAFLVRFDDRDQKSDKQIRVQLWVALGSLALSVLLSGFGVWFAAKSYYQDAEKNKADDASALIQTERDKKIDRQLDQNNKTLEAVQAMQKMGIQSVASPSNPKKP
jgi:hypothetical protein